METIREYLDMDKNDALSKLLPLLNNSSILERCKAAKVLGHIFHGTGNDKVVNGLEILFYNYNREVRESAVKAIAEIFKDNDQLEDKAIEKITPLIYYYNTYVQISAVETLSIIFEKRGRLELIDPLLSLFNSSLFVRDSAVKAITRIFKGTSNQMTVYNRLIKLMKHENKYVRLSVIETIGYLFAKSKNIKIAKELLKYINDDEIAIKKSIIEAITLILKETNSQEVLDMLEPLLWSDSQNIRYFVIKAFGEIFYQSNNQKVIEDLKNLLETSDKFVRIASIRAIGKVSIVNKTDLTRFLSQYLDDKDDDVKRAAAEVIANNCEQFINENIKIKFKKLLSSNDWKLQRSIETLVRKYGIL